MNNTSQERHWAKDAQSMWAPASLASPSHSRPWLRSPSPAADKLTMRTCPFLCAQLPSESKKSKNNCFHVFSSLLVVSWCCLMACDANTCFSHRASVPLHTCPILCTQLPSGLKNTVTLCSEIWIFMFVLRFHRFPFVFLNGLGCLAGISNRAEKHIWRQPGTIINVAFS